MAVTSCTASLLAVILDSETVICSRIIAGLSLDNQFLVAYYLAINGNPLMQLDSSWLDLWSICVCHWFLILFSFFIYLFPPTVLPSKNRDLLVLNMFASVCILKLSSGRGGSEDWKDVVMLKSTISICLSVRCLAWLSSTERWWWQNDKGGRVCTCHWMPIWLQSTISTEAPTCHKNKNGQSRGLWWDQITYLHKTYKVTTHSDTVNTVWQPAMPASTIWHLNHHRKRLPDIWRNGNGCIRTRTHRAANSHRSCVFSELFLDCLLSWHDGED